MTYLLSPLFDWQKIGGHLYHFAWLIKVRSSLDKSSVFQVKIYNAFKTLLRKWKETSLFMVKSKSGLAIYVVHKPGFFLWKNDGTFELSIWKKGQRYQYDLTIIGFLSLYHQLSLDFIKRWILKLRIPFRRWDWGDFHSLQSLANWNPGQLGTLFWGGGGVFPQSTIPRQLWKFCNIGLTIPGNWSFEIRQISHEIQQISHEIQWIS